jgi:hypothetical protein
MDICQVAAKGTSLQYLPALPTLHITRIPFACSNLSLLHPAVGLRCQIITQDTQEIIHEAPCTLSPQLCLCSHPGKLALHQVQSCMAELEGTREELRRRGEGGGSGKRRGIL